MQDLDKFKNEMNLSGQNVYVGHRYKPKMFGDWDNSQIYEPLSIVQYQGNSFTSRQHVPSGVEITNEEFWVSTGNYNAQIEQYRQDVRNLEKDTNNLNNEVVNARNGEETLKGRLDKEQQEVNAQLEQTIDNLNKRQKLITDFGVVMNSEEFQTEKVQEAIDYCIDNKVALFIPSGLIKVNGTIYIRNAIEINGHSLSTFNQASSRIIYDVPGTDVPILYIEKENGERVPGVKLNKIYIGRKRNQIDDDFKPDNVWQYGKKCTAIYAHVEESSFTDVVVLGCKIGFHFNDSQINDVTFSDLLFNETQIQLSGVSQAMNIENNNICYSKTTIHFKCRGYVFNYNNNHAESSTNHFIFELGSHDGTIRSYSTVNIKNSNFTQHSVETESFVKLITEGSSYGFLTDLIIEGVRVYQPNSGQPIVFNNNNSLFEINTQVLNSVFWTNGVITNDESKNLRILWNAGYFKGNGSKWDNTDYLTDNVYGLNTHNGLRTHSPIDLTTKYTFTNAPAYVKGRLYYYDTRNTLAFNNNKGKRLELPMSFHHEGGDFKQPTDTDVNKGTIAYNINGTKGSPSQWVYDGAEWVVTGQLGYRSGNVEPISGGKIPRYIGEEFLDTLTKTWYKSVGLTVQDWKAIQ